MGLEELTLKNIGDGGFEQFESYCKSLLKGDQKYREVFLYALSLADTVSGSYFKDQVVLVGGFAVLGHMIKMEGPEIVKRWRGSHDLDVVCQTPQALAFIIRELADESLHSLSLPDKKTAKFSDAYVDELAGETLISDADLYYPGDRKKPDQIRIGNMLFREEDFLSSDEVLVYHAPIKIYNKYGLLSMKLGVVTSENLPRPKDITDIYNLLGILEEKVGSAEDIYNRLTMEEREKLMEIFNYSDPRCDSFVLIPPSEGFVYELQKIHDSETKTNH